MLLAAVSLALLHYPIFSAAYSWSFQNTPQQCTNLSISITGSGGQPPYRVLIVPFGPSPLGNVEARKIQEFPFDTDSSISFKLNYPANSQFVAVVSDSSGFGTGGTSVAAQVTSSSDSSCFDSSKSVSGPWQFSVGQSTVVQCVATRLYWQDPTAVQGVPKFFGVIPGGQSFAIPQGTPDDEHNQGLGTGYSWTPSVRGGTTVIIVASDNTGTGSGGSNPFTVQNGPNNVVSCLNDQSPSSTPGSPAGGSYPTNSSGDTTGGGSGGTNVGAIVGGVIGGVVLILAFILVLLFLRRRDRHRHYKEKPTVDLAADDGDEAPARASRNELPQYYQPEPFVVPEPTTTGTESEYDPANRLSYASSGTTDLLSAPGGNSTTATSRKGGYQRHMRPVNIIQHDDAGPSGPVKEEEPETIELPPAYNKIKPASEVGTPASETTIPPLATTTTTTTTAPAA